VSIPTPPIYAGSDITAQLFNNTPVYTLLAATNQSISSTSPATITGMTIAVQAATYMINSSIVITQGSTAADQKFRFTGPAISSGRIVCTSLWTGASSYGWSTVTDINNSFLITGPITGSDPGVAMISGVYAFTGSGTLALTAGNNTGGDTCTIAANSWMTVQMVYS